MVVDGQLVGVVVVCVCVGRWGGRVGGVGRVVGW